MRTAIVSLENWNAILKIIQAQFSYADYLNNKNSEYANGVIDGTQECIEFIKDCIEEIESAEITSESEKNQNDK